MNRQVLVVDNRERYRDKLKLYFLIRGFSVTTANNGYEALSKLVQNKFNNNKSNYNLITTDCSMPKMDGLKLLSLYDRIQDPFHRKPSHSYTPAIMISRGRKINSIDDIHYSNLLGFVRKVNDDDLVMSQLDKIVLDFFIGINY